SNLIRFFPLVECLYVIGENGLQTSETIFGNLEGNGKNRFMFRPSPKGTDHAMKDYYFMMMDGGLKKTTFISEPYLSMATGNACVTFARLFKDLDGKLQILCVDINTQYLQNLSAT
ncbi:MAG TPA: PDC sensor domain-containing protein, partial [bacterium]|nr:PDC sensor domain-containing protein [bacterium]